MDTGYKIKRTLDVDKNTTQEWDNNDYVDRKCI